MTARQYKRIESLLAQVEEITLEHPLLTSHGQDIQKGVRELLMKVVAERIRAEMRDGSQETLSDSN